MAVGLIALHYPLSEHLDEMIQRMHRAAEVMATVPGCVEARVWLDARTRAVVGTGTWSSAEARAASFEAVAAADVDFDYDQREARPREVYELTLV